MKRDIATIWTKLVGPLGPGASGLVLGTALSAAAAVGIRSARRRGALRGAVLGGIAFDLVGGLVSFQLPPTRARYAATTEQQRMVFVATHLQPFVLPLTGEGSWPQAAARYGAAVATTALLETTPAEAPYRRGLAVGLAAALSVADLVVGSPHQRWFGPVYFVKLIGGHGSISRAVDDGASGTPPQRTR